MTESNDNEVEPWVEVLVVRGRQQGPGEIRGSIHVVSTLGCPGAEGVISIRGLGTGKAHVRGHPVNPHRRS
jgi:hypothetical protein